MASGTGPTSEERYLVGVSKEGIMTVFGQAIPRGCLHDRTKTLNEALIEKYET